MSVSSTFKSDNGPSTPQVSYDPNPPTVAAFSPNTLANAAPTSKQRTTIIVHKKSPLLIATPPQITRALAYSHPFLLPLNKLAGLLSWSTNDPWESFLVVVALWVTTLYGDYIIRYAGPIILVAFLILGMYARRYSPLSSTAQTGEKHEAKGHKRESSEASSPNHKSLDEIVETLREFTTRCNLLLDPFVTLTDFLSTQRTPTTATTRPALTTLFIRILLVTPVWIVLTLPPFRILTTRRVILTVGTITLSWHSRPARVSRVILWRSLMIRRVISFITGLSFSMKPNPTTSTPPDLPPRKKSQTVHALEIAKKPRNDSTGVRFTFILYENQRRWIGLGWTTSLFAYERPPWTDEQMNPAASKDDFELPEVEGHVARWRWLPGSSWKIEGGDASQVTTPSKSSVSVGVNRKIPIDGGGWIYYDNKWNDGRNTDGWGRYTRRRRWYRDAELTEISPSTEVTPAEQTQTDSEGKADFGTDGGSSEQTDLSSSTATVKEQQGKRWFGRKKADSDSKSSGSGHQSTGSDRSRDALEDDRFDRFRAVAEREGGYGFGEEAKMGLG